MKKIVCLALFIFSLAILSCGGGGGGSFTSNELEVVLGQDGPGDIGDHYPLTAGNFWHFSGTNTTEDTVTFYGNSIYVSGTIQVGDVPCVAVRESGSYGEMIPFVRYLVEDPNGIAVMGADGGDPWLAQVVPYWETRFPLVPGESFIQTDRVGLDFGEDLDWDGKNESFDLEVTSAVLATETVSVPAGTFAGAVRLDYDLNMSVRLSYSRQRISATGTETVWLAPGVGAVKRASAIEILGEVDSATELLDGYIVDGQAEGITMVSGILVDGQVEAGQRNVYAFSTDPGQDMTVGLTWLSGDADLIPYLPDMCLSGITGRTETDPEHCSVSTAGDNLIVAVDNAEGATVDFSLVIAQTPSVASTPVSEGTWENPVVIEPDVPTTGQVETRGDSYYHVTFPASGEHDLTVFGGNGPGPSGWYLEVFSDDTYSMRLPCTESSFYDDDHCTLESTDGFYFKVNSGPINYDGATYVILAR